MGWCSGTPIFDRVCEKVLELRIKDEAKEGILLALAEEMERQDWDCQYDSDYFDHPIVQRVMKELHPTWEFD